MNEYYWEITERDGTVTPVPPAAVEVVKRRWGNGDPIHFKTKSIPASQIIKFTVTNRPFGQLALGSGAEETPEELAEDAARAFKEPIYVERETDYGYTEIAIKGRWVKQVVTMDKWNRYYSSIPSYKYLGEDNGMAIIAFVIAAHDVDPYKTPYCTDEEIRQLTSGK